MFQNDGDKNMNENNCVDFAFILLLHNKKVNTCKTYHRQYQINKQKYFTCGILLFTGMQIQYVSEKEDYIVQADLEIQYVYIDLQY